MCLDVFSEKQPSCAGRFSTLLSTLLFVGFFGALVLEWATGEAPTAIEIGDISNDVHTLSVKCSSPLGCYVTYVSHGECRNLLPHGRTIYIGANASYKMPLCASDTGGWADGAYVTGVYSLDALQNTRFLISSRYNSSDAAQIVNASTLASVSTPPASILPGNRRLTSVANSVTRLSPPLEYQRSDGKWISFPFVTAPSLKYTSVEFAKELECKHSPKFYGVHPINNEDCGEPAYTVGATSLTAVDCVVPRSSGRSLANVGAICYAISLNRLQKTRLRLPRVTLYEAFSEFGGMQSYAIFLGYLFFVVLNICEDDGGEKDNEGDIECTPNPNITPQPSVL